MAFTTREHCCENKTEMMVQAVCLLLTCAGFACVMSATEDDPSISDAQRDQIAFRWVVALTLVLLLLLNAAKHNNVFVPLLMALGFYWFPEAISFVDSWRRNRSNFKNYDLLMFGGVISITCTSVATLFEGTLPGGRALMPLDYLGIVVWLVSFAGLMVVWIYNDESANYGTVGITADFVFVQRLSIKTLIALVMLADSVLHSDVTINTVSVFMGVITVCDVFTLAILYDDASGDKEKVLQGLFVAAFGLGLLTAFTTFSVAMQRNQSSRQRRGAFQRSTQTMPG